MPPEWECLRAAIKKGVSFEAPFSVASAIISEEVIEEIPGIGVVAVAAIAVPAVAVTAVTIVAVVGALVGGTRLGRLGGCVEGELYLDRLTLAVDGDYCALLQDGQSGSG